MMAGARSIAPKPGVDVPTGKDGKHGVGSSVNRYGWRNGRDELRAHATADLRYLLLPACRGKGVCTAAQKGPFRGTVE